MANQNLSQFGEKLFVADADHTFIWDSEASISKRVSRNSWLNSGTLTSDAPVTISQTWNQIGTAFTAFKVNAVSTASASSSLLADFQLGTVSKLKVDKNGGLISSSGSLSGLFLSSGTDGMEVVGGALFAFSSSNIVATINRSAVKGFSTTWDGAFAFGTSNTNANVSGADTILLRDAANTLALRNGAAAQTFNVYGTYTSGSVYERMFMRYNGTDLAFQVGAETLGATARPLQLWTGGASRLHITTAGNVGIGTTGPSEKLHVLGGKVLFGDISDPTGTAGNGELTLHARTLPQLNMVSNVGVNSFFGLSLKAGTAERAGLLVNMQSGEVKMGALSGSGYFPTFWSNGVEIMRLSTGGNVGIGTTSPTSKLHVAGSSSPSITVDNTLATGASQLLFKNTVVTGDTDGIFLNGSAQSGFGGAGSLNIKATTGPIAFHTASVTNALSIAQSGAVSMAGSLSANGSVAAGNIISFGGSSVVLKDLGSGKMQILNSAQTVGCTLDAATDGYAKFRLRGSSTVFAAVQGKLTTDTDYTATVVTPTGFLTLYDAQGTAYRVPCVLAP